MQRGKGSIGDTTIKAAHADKGKRVKKLSELICVLTITCETSLIELRSSSRVIYRVNQEH